MLYLVCSYIYIYDRFMSLLELHIEQIAVESVLIIRDLSGNP